MVMGLVHTDNFAASRSLVVSWPITSLLSIVCSLCGLVMFAHYVNCDPLLNGEVKSSDQLLPYFMMHILSSLPGLPGFFIAGIFSGALSTVSSFVNSLAAVTLEDYVKPFCCRNTQLSDKRSTQISKVLAFMFGLICLLVTYLAEQMTGILQASLTIFGIVGGPLLALFTLGICFPRCNSTGAFVGFLVSLTIGFWIGFGTLASGVKPVALPRYTHGCNSTTESSLSLHDAINVVTTNSPAGNENDFYLYRLSYMWYAGLTWLIGLIVAMAISLLMPKHKIAIDRRFLATFLRSKNDAVFFDELEKVKTNEEISNVDKAVVKDVKDVSI